MIGVISSFLLAITYHLLFNHNKEAEVFFKWMVYAVEMIYHMGNMVEYQQTRAGIIGRGELLNAMERVLVVSSIDGHKETRNKEAFKTALIGRLFEEASYSYIDSHESGAKKILSPFETLAFFRRLYPDAIVENDYFGPSSFRGISVPDGILLNFNMRIEVVYEYTTTRSSLMSIYCENKIHEFVRRQNEFPDFFRGSELRFITPDRGRLNEKPYKINDFAVIEEIPVQTSEIVKFVNEWSHIENAVRSLSQSLPLI